jgi:pimeloyl-ACP methyl ester carboxylesterase
LQHIAIVDDSVAVVLAPCALWLPLLNPYLFCLSCSSLFTDLQHIPTVDDSVAVVLAALQRHGLASAAVLGHSYGSLVAARLVRVAPQVVHTLAVVDPVSLLEISFVMRLATAVRRTVQAIVGFMSWLHQEATRAVLFTLHQASILWTQTEPTKNSGSQSQYETAFK